MGSLREKMLEEEHRQALMSSGSQSMEMIARMVEAVQELKQLAEGIDARLAKVEAWIEHEDTRALEASEY